jgi:hypothetical protein
VDAGVAAIESSRLLSACGMYNIGWRLWHGVEYFDLGRKVLRFGSGKINRKSFEHWRLDF